MTGTPSAPEFWQILYHEVDAANRYVFTLCPLRLPYNLPKPDFSTISNALLRGQAEQHWKDLENAVIHNQANATVNAATALCETVLCHLIDGGKGTSERILLGHVLQEIREKRSQAPVEPGSMAYHLMETIRHLHKPAQHAGNVVARRRPCRPELSMLASEAVIEVLGQLGFLQQ